MKHRNVQHFISILHEGHRRFDYRTNLLQIMWSRNSPFTLISIGGERHSKDPRFWVEEPDVNNTSKQSWVRRQTSFQEPTTNRTTLSLITFIIYDGLYYSLITSAPADWLLQCAQAIFQSKSVCKLVQNFSERERERVVKIISFLMWHIRTFAVAWAWSCFYCDFFLTYLILGACCQCRLLIWKHWVQFNVTTTICLPQQLECMQISLLQSQQRPAQFNCRFWSAVSLHSNGIRSH